MPLMAPGMRLECGWVPLMAAEALTEALMGTVPLMAAEALTVGPITGASAGWLPVLEMTPFGSDDDAAKREALFARLAAVQAGTSLRLLAAPSVRAHRAEPRHTRTPSRG